MNKIFSIMLTSAMVAEAIDPTAEAAMQATTVSLAKSEAELAAAAQNTAERDAMTQKGAELMERMQAECGYDDLRQFKSDLNLLPALGSNSRADARIARHIDLRRKKSAEADAYEAKWVKLNAFYVANKALIDSIDIVKKA